MATLRPTVTEQDSYISKIIKYIPAESIALYEFIEGVIPQENRSEVIPLVALAIIVLTPIWMALATKPDNGQVKFWQFHVVISPFAFFVWLIALSSPAVEVVFGSPVESWQGSIILAIVSGIIPLLEIFSKRLFPEPKKIDHSIIRD